MKKIVKRFEMLSTPFKTLFEVSKSIYGPQVFIFVNKFEVCLFSTSQKALGAFLTLKNQKYCEALNFSINFIKLKKLYQKSVRLRFLGYV